jgi:UDP-glucose 4-epimerase
MGRKVLVCGGAGYIGSHMCEQLAAHGMEVVVFDNLAGGRRAHVRWGELVFGDLRNPGELQALFDARKFDAVMQFAGKIVASESVREPSSYHEHNVTGMRNLLDAARAHDAPPVVFSSSAAVYGDAVQVPIDEDHACLPANPYGRTKLAAERMLGDFRAAHGLRSVALRYFNAAGASPGGLIGEAHEPETHLIPNALRAARSGAAVEVFGDDYGTADGTCVRDYVHVADVCCAHLAALDYLWGGGENVVVNVGSGAGHSVLEVVAAAERVSGRRIARHVAARRDGDPPVLVASTQRARQVLGWQPTQSNLPTIVESAWRWEQRRVELK